MSVSSSPGSASAGAPPVHATGQVQLAPDAVAKIRNPIVVAILAIVTLGIYLIFLQYFINKEMADYGRARGTAELGTDPTKSTLALFPGALIVIPAVWTTVTTFQRVQAAQRADAGQRLARVRAVHRLLSRVLRLPAERAQLDVECGGGVAAARRLNRS